MSDNHVNITVIMECLYKNKIATTKGEVMQELDMDTAPDTMYTIQNAPVSSCIHLACILYGPK